MTTIIGPNSGASSEIISKNVILCCGEDASELLAAVNSFIPEQVIKYHEYRCYKFWKFSEFTLAWTGIGTGCLEPLLWEVLKTQIVKKIIIIGTAGQFPNSKTHIGEVYVIDQAYLAATAVDELNIDHPLRPCFQASDACETATIVSTDLFYGFSQHGIDGVYSDHKNKLQNALDKHSKHRDMVDMEVGQFYYFCHKLNSNKNLEYLAIKGSSNRLEHFKELTINSSKVIKKSLQKALKLLQIPVANEKLTTRIRDSSNTNKLIEEIKLYWSIQIATAGILGYLGTNINTIDHKTFLIAFVAYLLVNIGAIYNFVGNYYIEVAGESIGFTEKQENLITPFIAKIYALISGILGSLILLSLLNIIKLFVDETRFFDLKIPVALIGFIIGFGVHWSITRKIYRGLYEKGSLGYIQYSQKIRKWFLMK